MSVTSVLPVLASSYSPLSGINSRSAKFATPTEQLQEKTTTKADGSRVTTNQVSGATHDIPALKDGGSIQKGYADPTDVSQFHSALAQALRANGATAGSSTSRTSGPAGTQSSVGVALYKRISQISTDDPSAAALLRSWNNIMQSGQNAGGAGAASLQAFSQNEATAFEPGSLDLTA